MAKYFKEQNRIERMRQEKADLPIAISGEKYEGVEMPELICPSCWYITKQRYGVDHEYTCNHCNHVFNPAQEELRTKSRLSVKGGHDKESRVAYPKDPDADFYNKDKIEPQGAFKALQDRGLKITSYSEIGPDGRPLKRNRWA